MNENNNVVKFKKVPTFSIGIVIIVIIFVYVVFHFYSYMTKSNITIAIVKQGNIVWDDHYNALAIRDENLYYASEEGYIYYQARSKSRVGVKSLIYSLDQTGDISKLLRNEEVNIDKLADEDKAAVISDIDAFVNEFDTVNYRRTYTFSANLSDTLKMAYSNQATRKLKDEIKDAEKHNTFHRYYAPNSGLVVLSVDGMENVSVQNFTKKSFQTSSLNYQNLRNNDKVLSGQIVYKLVTSDYWKLVMPVDDQIARRLADEKVLEIRFTDDGSSTWANCEIIDREKQKYLVLSLDDSMDRYADLRFVGIDLVLDEENGLKVPNSSIATKRYDLIPADYATKGGDSETTGFLVDRGKETPEFIPTGYFKQDENDMLWVPHDKLKDGDIVIGEDGSKFVIPAKGEKLKGVYNVNKGYAQFKPVDVLYNNEEYSIIKPIKNNEVNLYDHIALKADTIVEDDVLL
ncbi:MAG: hypothetical protein K6F00_08935 [Lachnospiraceae bacterium]|nr:hypothetical protein [Lachnospiraceae bacterium]